MQCAIFAIFAIEIYVVCEVLRAGVAVVDESLVEGEVDGIINYAAAVEDGLVGVGVCNINTAVSACLALTRETGCRKDAAYSSDRCYSARRGSRYQRLRRKAAWTPYRRL